MNIETNEIVISLRHILCDWREKPFLMPPHFENLFNSMQIRPILKNNSIQYSQIKNQERKMAAISVAGDGGHSVGQEFHEVVAFMNDHYTNYPTATIAFDSQEELLWAGTESVSAWFSCVFSFILNVGVGSPVIVSIMLFYV